MRHRLLRPIATTAALSGVAALTVLTGVGTAHAVTSGSDDPDNTYGAVGLTLTYDAGGQHRCTAALVSPTVMLTAGHCTDGALGRTLVDLRPFVSAEGPPDYPRAADRGQGFTQDEITAAGFVSARSVTHPAYEGLVDKDRWFDVGVLLLDEPVTSVAPLAIAPVGTLGGIKQSDLSKTLFRTIGYGAAIGKSATGPQKPTPFDFPLARRYADEPGKKLTEQILYTDGNDNDAHGTGGSCFGDSGGPVLEPGTGAIVAVISFGHVGTCRYTNGNQRVDLASVRAWLATFGA